VTLIPRRRLLMGKLMVGVARILQLCCAVALVFPALAASQSVTLSSSQDPVNTEVTATGMGWSPSIEVLVFFESQPIGVIGGPVIPDAQGAFTTKFCVPNRQPNLYPVFFTNGRENFNPPFTITAGTPGDCQATVSLLSNHRNTVALTRSFIQAEPAAAPKELPREGGR
jgi:hypothetical protein